MDAGSFALPKTYIFALHIFLKGKGRPTSQDP